MNDQVNENLSFLDSVYIGDSRNMWELPDGSVDLVVTSPPYFSVKDYSKDGHQKSSHSLRHINQLGDLGHFDEFISQLVHVWKECERVLHPNGKLVINTPLMPMLKREMNTHENRHIFDLNSSIQQSILNGTASMFLLDTYIWNRSNPTKKLMFGSYPYPTNFYAQNTIEFVTVFVKSGKAKTRDKHTKESSRLSQQEWVDFTKQIWDIPIPNRGDLAFGKHAALMPEELVRRCVRLFSFEGDVVLDPFAGSGTTLKVAKELGRHFTGYEVMPAYADLINKKVGGNVCKTRKPKPKLHQANTQQVPKLLIDGIKNEDVFTFLGRLPSNSIDLACIDPPYNLGKGDWDKWDSHEEFMSFTKRWLNEVFRVTRPGGSIFVFNTPRNSAYILAHAEALGMSFENWITWDKRDGFSATKRRFVPCQETITYFTKPGAKATFNADLVRIPYDSTDRISAAVKTGIIKNGKRWFPNPSGKLCTDVWHVVSERHKHKENGRTKKMAHPTQKPLELIERIILAASQPGDLVLDCFMGSGTTAIAAVKHSRRFLGCETDPEHYRTALDRLDNLST